MKAGLVVMSGLPGVGKTTLARGVATHLGAVYVRIDSVEAALRKDHISEPIGSAGYVVAHAIAADNLALGRMVVADSVNPWMLTRDAWCALAERHRAECFEVEVVCTDEAEHRRRVECRSNDVPGLVLPTWKDVREREYHAWTRERIVVDTARRDPDACVKDLLERLASDR